MIRERKMWEGGRIFLEETRDPQTVNRNETKSRERERGRGRDFDLISYIGGDVIDNPLQKNHSMEYSTP